MDLLLRTRWNDHVRRLGNGDERVMKPSSAWGVSGRSVVVALALAAAACGPAAESPKPPAAGEWLEFEGSWNAAGSRQTIPLGADRRGSILDLRGTMLLAGAGRPGVGFRSEVIALVDSATGLVGRSVWTDERGDQVFSELTGRRHGGAQPHHGTILGGTGRYAGVTGSYEFSWQWVMEAEDGVDPGTRRRLQGPRSARPAAPQEVPAMTAPGCDSEAGGALRDRDRHLVLPGSGRAHGAGVAPVRGLRRGHRVGADRRVPAAHGLDARRGRRRSHRDDHAGAGLLGFRQFERAARGGRVHRRAGGGEVGSRPAHQPLHGEPLRRLLARPRLQHRADRRGHRAGVPQQHGARRRALPDRAVRGQGGGLQARGPRRTAARRLPHVLRDGEPRGLFRPLDDGHLVQPDRRADRAESRARDRLRKVVPRLLGAVAHRDRAVASARREALPAPRRQDTRGPRGGAQGSRQHGADVARRVDHGRDLRADGRRLGVRQQR